MVIVDLSCNFKYPAIFKCFIYRLVLQNIKWTLIFCSYAQVRSSTDVYTDPCKTYYCESQNAPGIEALNNGDNYELALGL